MPNIRQSNTVIQVRITTDAEHFTILYTVSDYYIPKSQSGWASDKQGKPVIR